ncbi:MAG TPA: HD domain-containing protein [Syntrophorhabdaceae bacterium]|nr:HD domain-containing protein [Syntrophorhabdaceae bacterium]
MDKKIFVRDITEEGATVNDYFVVSRKGTYTTKTNAKYISLNLKDKSGVIEAKVWERVDELNSLFEKNDIVYVKGRPRVYQEKLQLNITDIKRVDEELPFELIRQFFPESETNCDALKEEYFKVTGEFKNRAIGGLFTLINEKKEMLEKFFFYPASIGVHHTYVGGLLEHSLSMTRMARTAAEALRGDLDIILAGCLLHDIGKIEEIDVKRGFRYTDRGRLMGHIALGVTILSDLIRETKDFPDHLADALYHIIVSHHGVEEWGSPKKPMFIEALVVHYLDNLDAKVMGVKEHMKENMEDERWTEYHRLYESRFYKIPEE